MKSRKGFGVLEIIIVIGILAAIGVVVWYAMSGSEKPTPTPSMTVASPSPTVTPTTTYTSPEKNYTLALPTGWEAKVLTQGAGYITVTGSPLGISVPGKSFNPIISVIPTMQSKDEALRLYFDGIQYSKPIEKTNLTINGYSVTQADTTSDENTMRVYFITDGKMTLIFNMAKDQKSDSTTAGIGFENEDTLSAFEALIKSVKFN